MRCCLKTLTCQPKRLSLQVKFFYMDFESNFWEDEQHGLINRFEDMLKEERMEYFDVNEFVDIIDYYLDFLQNSQAVNAINLALKFHPSSAEILVKKAQALLLKSDLNKAAEVLRLAQNLDESNADIYVYWGVYFLKRGQNRESERSFLEAISKSDNETLVDTYYLISRAYRGEGMLDEAIRYLIDIYKIEPENSDVMFELASTYREIEDYEEEINIYDEALDKDPFEELIWYQKGNAHWELGQIAKAIDAFEFSIAIDPRFTLPVVDLADLYIDQGMYQKAIDVLLYYLEFDTEMVTIYCFLAECYMKLGKYDKSIETYEKALVVDSEYSPVWFGIGEVYFNEQQYHESYLYIRKALKINPEKGVYWRHMGTVQMELGFERHALRSFERATNYAPNDKESWLLRFVSCYFGQGIDAAYQVVCQAIELFQSEAEFYFYKTACLIEKEEIPAAEQSFVQALTLNKEAFDDFAIFYPKIFAFDNFKILINTFITRDNTNENVSGDLLT